MKLRPLKIGQFVIPPKLFLAVLGALFILGLGIGVTVASSGNSLLALILCAIISIIIVFYSVSKHRGN